MIAFQYVAVATLAAVLAADFALAVRRRRLSAAWLARSLTWVTAAVTILFPGLVQAVALWAGVRRGADLVLYVFILIFLFTSFYFYARYRAVQRQVTELIRCYALDHARRGGGARTEFPGGRSAF